MGGNALDLTICCFVLILFCVCSNRQGQNHIIVSNRFFCLYFLDFRTMQAERFVDRKLDQAESVLKRKQKKVKKWYSAFIGDENGARVNELHIFAIAFGAGVALGFASS